MADKTPEVKSPEAKTVSIDADVLAKMQAQIAALNKATIVEATVAQCNVCGDTLAADAVKCPKHPNDLTNHVRPATDKEKAAANAGPQSDMNTLVRQS